MGCSRGHHTERGGSSIGAGTCACARAYPRARHALCLEAQAGPSTGVSLPQAPVAGKGSTPRTSATDTTGGHVLCRLCSRVVIATAQPAHPRMVGQ